MSGIEIILVAHPSRDDGENTPEVVDKIYSTLRDVVSDVSIALRYVEDISELQNILLNASESSSKIIICPIFVKRGSHYRQVEELVNNISKSKKTDIVLLSPLLYSDDVLNSIATNIVKAIDLLDTFRRNILENTGDYALLCELKMNRDLNTIRTIFRNSKILICDDMRFLAYLNIEEIQPGLRIMFEEDSRYFSYPPDSVVVVCSSMENIRKIMDYVRQGVRPSLIIAVPPALSEHDIMLKRNVLNLDIPAVVTIGSRGGPHVAGLLVALLVREIEDERRQT